MGFALTPPVRLAGLVIVVVSAACASPVPPAVVPAPVRSSAHASEQRPATPVVPPRSLAIQEFDARFPTKDMTLEGTLTVPVGDGPWPGIVLIHASGPGDRDEHFAGQLGMQFGFEVKVFKNLSDDLASSGYAVLRYDKRTCLAAGYCRNAYPEVADFQFHDIVNDALASVDWLGHHPLVDARRVYVVGHSQGATLVPTLLRERSSVRAGAMLAPLHSPIEKGFAYQAEFVRRQMKGDDVPPFVIDQRLVSLDGLVRSLHALRENNYHGRSIGSLSLSFWREWMAQVDSAPQHVQALDRPVLLLFGSEDTNVPTSEAALWRRTLARVDPNPGHRMAVLPCISHALSCLSGSGDERTSAERVDPRVADTVLRFFAPR